MILSRVQDALRAAIITAAELPEFDDLSVVVTRDNGIDSIAARAAAAGKSGGIALLILTPEDGITAEQFLTAPGPVMEFTLPLQVSWPSLRTGGDGESAAAGYRGAEAAAETLVAWLHLRELEGSPLCDELAVRSLVPGVDATDGEAFPTWDIEVRARIDFSHINRQR